MAAKITEAAKQPSHGAKYITERALPASPKNAIAPANTLDRRNWTSMEWARMHAMLTAWLRTRPTVLLDEARYRQTLSLDIAYFGDSQTRDILELNATP